MIWQSVPATTLLAPLAQFDPLQLWTPTAIVGTVHTAWQVAAVSVPVVQDDVPLTVYPVVHVGWHVAADAKVFVQSPAAPFVGAALASQEFAWQVAAVSVPVVQDDVPLGVYPVVHVGWHVDADAKVFVQSPAPPFVGAALASQEFALDSYTSISIKLSMRLLPGSCTET